MLGIFSFRIIVACFLNRFFTVFNSWIKRLRIYGTISNLATITGYSGIDPDVSISGLAPGVDNLSLIHIFCLTWLRMFSKRLSSRTMI